MTEKCIPILLKQLNLKDPHVLGRDSKRISHCCVTLKKNQENDDKALRAKKTKIFFSKNM